MRWLNDILVNSSTNKNIAELQDITVERHAERWRFELFVTQKQKRAADRYYEVWTHSRRRRPFCFKGLEHFSRGARRDGDTLAGCIMLLELLAERKSNASWREVRASMGRYANHVDNMVLHGAEPMWWDQDSWVDALRIGLSHLAAFFEARRKLDYELRKLGETIEHVGNVDCGAGVEVVPRRLGANERQTEKAA